MRILLLAPHPFYQERGTPIAVDMLISALAKRAEQLDVLTYHEGEDRPYPPNVTIRRIPPQPLAHNIRPGFSLKKLVCDAAMYRVAWKMARNRQYNCIHAVEESVFIARRVGRKLGIPYIFDMDSSMPRQIADKLPIARPLLPLMRNIEKHWIRDAAAVVPMCRELADYAENAGARHVEILSDISLIPENNTPNPDNGFRRELGFSAPALLYIGNLETYQGIDLMLNAFSIAAAQEKSSRLVIVGGREDDISKYRNKARDLQIENRVHFLGPRPLAHMADLFHDADILISPRTQGNNTPMKIYSYLGSHRAILATDLPTHTQVLNTEIARLTEPQPEAMATAMLELLNNPDKRKRLAQNAHRLARSKYSPAAFRATVNSIYDYIATVTRQHTHPAHA